MKKLLALALLFAVTAPALAWNDRGHMVVARLAWKKLNDCQRARVVALLRKHPHYKEYLAAGRPEGFSEDEWVFLRGATWSDWVGTQSDLKREFAHPAWHFINYPYVPHGSRVDAAEHQPQAGQEHIVQALTDAIEKLKTGTDSQKAIYLCWLLHLVGDIHQPLHCAQMVSEQFARGDQGGNLVLIRVRTQRSPVRLHALWDGLLGTSLKVDPIARDCDAIEAVLKEKAARIQPDLKEHTTFESWAKESFELAKKIAYLDGELKFAPAEEQLDGVEAPEAPADYVSTAERTARLQIGKAGVRLAEQLGKLFP